MPDLLLDFLFPHGFILMIIVMFALVMFGAIGGFMMKKCMDENASGALVYLGMLVCGGLLGALLCYHFMWYMLCRQFACG